MEKQYILTVFSENKVGILNQITTVLTCRNVNIESLTTSESAVAGIHRFTIVVNTDPEKVEKMVRQIEKRIQPPLFLRPVEPCAGIPVLQSGPAVLQRARNQHRLRSASSPGQIFHARDSARLQQPSRFIFRFRL